MSKRKWGAFSSLAYFYNAFACLADGKLVKEETTKIIEVLLGWTNQEEKDLKAVAGFVVQAEIWLKEDIDGSTDKKDLVNDSLNTCIEIVKKELTKDQCKGVLIGLVEIGMADGNYDESEKGWVKMLADRLDIEPPKIQNTSNESADIKEEDTGYAGITLRKFEDEAKQKAVKKYLVKWQDKTKTYNGRLGITGIIPEYFEDIDKACPKWSLDELDSIIQYSNDKKVIPSLQYVPDDFFTMTKQVWWLVPLVIWRGDIASWLFIDKNGFNAPHPDNEDGALIFPWDNIGSIEFEEIEHNLFRMSLYQRGSDGFLTFEEFVPNGSGSYLRMIDTIYKLNQATIEASRDAQQWFHGVGGEGMKSFESPSDLLSKEKWEDANYPNPSFFGYVDPEMKKEEDRINKIIEKSSDDWTKEEIDQIIKHKDYGKGSKEGDDLILKIASHPKTSAGWLEDFVMSGAHPLIVAAHIVKNASVDSDLLVNAWEENKIYNDDEIRNNILAHPNCPESLKDGNSPNEGENTKPVSRKESKKPKAKKKLTLHEQLASELEKLYPNSEVKKINEGNKLDIHLPDVNNKKGTHICFNCAKTGGIKIHFYSRDKLFNDSILNNNPGILEETSGRIRLVGYPSFKTVKDAIKSAEGFIKLLSVSSKTKKEEPKKSKTNKKLTLQGQLVDELSKLYPTADVKKVDDGNYLDIHMPDIHPKRGTHIWFNTPKAGGIKVGFFCRDKDFIEDALKRNPATIETYSNGLRLLGHPTFKKVDDAIKVADTFVKMLKK